MVSILLIAVLLGITVASHARDDGRYAKSPLKPWFDSLKSGKGPCCSDADGTALSDPDWKVVDGHYQVHIEGQWYTVPDDAILKQPNMYGRTMVWPVISRDALTNKIIKLEVRCFIVGSMT